MTLRDDGSSWCTHGAHMVTEIKEYDIRAHGYGMVVKNERSGLSFFSIFLSHSYFPFDLFSIILFLELGLGLE